MKGSFNSVGYTDEKVRECKFAFQFEKWRIEKKEEFDGDELSPERYRHIEILSQFKLSELRYKKGAAIPLKSTIRKNIMNTFHAFFSWVRRHGAMKEIPRFPEIVDANKTRRKALTRGAQEYGLQNIP